MYTVQGSEVYAYTAGSRAGPFDLSGLLDLVKANSQPSATRRSLLEHLGTALDLPLALPQWRNASASGGSSVVRPRRGLLQSDSGLAISSLDYDSATGTLWVVLSNG